ncbi:hypothetical protein MWH25_10385 [Natroniella acetigena]|uniref:hypothetical protein n=1 Tax=Natroniella acetigena TaxID=52004 RepID=UPI00200AA5CE|nr:hypothetical protein [Natroniella acetigena]MCK8828138.1 hypothetical protein [Natroniella acetigena]
MLQDNIFWPLVEELWPIYLMICVIVAAKRIGQGIWRKLNGEDDGISEAINDIIVGFFFAHTALAFIAVVWYLMQGIGTTAEGVVELIVNRMGFYE